MLLARAAIPIDRWNPQRQDHPGRKVCGWEFFRLSANRSWCMSLGVTIQAGGGVGCLLRSPFEGLRGYEFCDTQISFSDLHLSMFLICAAFLQRLEFRYVFSYHGLERISSKNPLAPARRNKYPHEREFRFLYFKKLVATKNILPMLSVLFDCLASENKAKTKTKKKPQKTKKLTLQK